MELHRCWLILKRKRVSSVNNAHCDFLYLDPDFSFEMMAVLHFYIFTKFSENPSPSSLSTTTTTMASLPLRRILLTPSFR